MPYPEFYSSEDGRKVVMLLDDRKAHTVRYTINEATGQEHYSIWISNYSPDDLRGYRRDLILCGDADAYRKACRMLSKAAYEEYKLAKQLYQTKNPHL
jgi:hypothetical protein